MSEPAVDLSTPSHHSEAPNLSIPEPRTVSPAQHNPTLEEPPQEDQYGHYHGSASGFAFLQSVKDRLASLPSMSLDFSDYPLAVPGKRPGILPPKAITDTLVRDYFDFGLTTSRFVHEPTLRVAYEKLYSTQGDDGLGQDDVALVYMVVAMGSHYSQTNNVFCGFSASLQFFDMARQEIERESTKVTLSSLQTRLLMIHYLLNHSRMHDAWSSFGIIVRQAQALGLHRLSTGRPSNYVDHEYRKRVFWSIYTYDRVLSSIFGRPCALHDDDIDQEECALVNDDDVSISECRARDSTEASFCTAAALIHYARLAQILGMVLREFYSPRRRNHSLYSLQAAALNLQERLLSWQQSLPAYLNYLSLPPSAMSTMIQRQMCTLKLTFAHTSLLLYRPFMLYSIRANAQIPHDLEVWLGKCGDLSVEAANVVVAECQYLYERGLFSRVFWFVNYAQFAAIGTLYMHSCLWPDPRNVREVADNALAQFPVGVDGDLIGQRYLEILKELQELTLGFSLLDVGPNSALSLDSMSAKGISVFDDLLMNYGDPWGTGIGALWTNADNDGLPHIEP
ncbi:fungal specific transcription factor domain-containing protein [Aspergillus puulaauensis]|uniref:Xylanolytic transcriptional activator regulatory domain-containing protein n=1 Tax=Aspergillus puulaauensis TaxID=1220207 RepID=A0A7R7XU36_9EURO|nr:uncharacterized protein APUU_51619A [Aspergillus puulaauensis]BCS26908.1 hypothetical protein APUU_51619A [Aspergillus puulaauensis]